MVPLPRLYPILDAACFPSKSGLLTAAEELAFAGVTLIQYRNKSGNAPKCVCSIVCPSRRSTIKRESSRRGNGRCAINAAGRV